ncbi:hypothetical protein MTO96_001017 [Rhipicephalus appendiculatus]
MGLGSMSNALEGLQARLAKKNRRAPGESAYTGVTSRRDHVNRLLCKQKGKGARGRSVVLGAAMPRLRVVRPRRFRDADVPATLGRSPPAEVHG